MKKTTAVAEYSRRRFLRDSSVIGVTAGLAACGGGGGSDDVVSLDDSGLNGSTNGNQIDFSQLPLTPENLPAAPPEVHLLKRATWGPNQLEVNRIRQMGMTAWLDGQLDHLNIDDSDVESLPQGEA